MSKVVYFILKLENSNPRLIQVQEPDVGSVSVHPFILFILLSAMCVGVMSRGGEEEMFSLSHVPLKLCAVGSESLSLQSEKILEGAADSLLSPPWLPVEDHFKQQDF